MGALRPRWKLGLLSFYWVELSCPKDGNFVLIYKGFGMRLNALKYALLPVEKVLENSIVPFKKTMEVFHMYKTERNQIYQDANAHQKSYSTYERRPKIWRSKRRQWDYIICKVCTGCGKQLRRYDNLKGYAFCFSCREILFPETVRYQESRGFTSPYPDSRWHAL